MSDGIVRPQPRAPQRETDYAGETREPAVHTGQPRLFKPIMVVTPPRGKHRVKLSKTPWNTFNGEFAGAVFKDGMSVGLLSEVASDRIGAMMACEDEHGNPLGKHQREMAARSVTIQSTPDMRTLADMQTDVDPAEADVSAIDAANALELARSVPLRTYDELGLIADTKGIAGLREIADPLGVKGRSIPDLIEAIVKAQMTLIGADPSSILTA